MTNNLILVTPPDDIGIDGFRVILFDLTKEQNDLVSKSLAKIDHTYSIITYIYQYGNSLDWIFDKKHKSDLIIFNADHFDQMVVGYLTAQKNSHYFGQIRDLKFFNNKVIYTQDDCVEIFNMYMRNYER